MEFGSSPGWISVFEKSIDLRRRRGGVPVFNRPSSSPISLSDEESPIAAESPARPPDCWFDPICIKPLKKVPVVMTMAFPMILNFHRCFNSERQSIFVQNFGRLALFNIQIRFGLTNPFHSELICLFVALCPRCPDSRAFLRIQHSKLQSGHICCLSHLSAHGINLTRQVSLWQVRRWLDCTTSGQWNQRSW